MKIAITGHRPNKLGNDYDLTSPLIQWIKLEIEGILLSFDKKGYTTFTNNKPNIEIDDLTLITGMALGIDTLFAKIAIENNIPFIAAIPCVGQEYRWIKKSQDLYNEILSHPLCTKNLLRNSMYTNTCMQHRNVWMVDNCDLLIAVWDGTSGGTANCVRYAKKVNKEIIIINPLDYNHG